MRDLSAVLIFVSVMVASTVIATFLSDWAGARRFSKRITTLEHEQKRDTELLMFLLHALNVQGTVTVTHKKQDINTPCSRCHDLCKHPQWASHEPCERQS